MYRLYLNITTGGQTTQYDATDELTNWADVSLSYKRDGLSGVVRSFSTEFIFAGVSRDALVAAYIADGVRSVASVQFQQRDAVAYTYTTLFTCALDFSTFRYDALTCSINAIDNTIAGKLKAQGSQKYQWAVSSLTGRNVTYHHLPMLNSVQWVVMGDYDDQTDKEFGHFGTVLNQPAFTMLTLGNTGSEIAVKGTCDFNDVPQKWGKTDHLESKVTPFFTAGIDMTASVDFYFNIGTPVLTGYTISVFDVVLAKLEQGEDSVTLSVLESESLLDGGTAHFTDDYPLNAGDSLVLYLLVTADQGTLSLKQQTSYQIYDASLSVIYEATETRNDIITSIAPATLLQAILDKICGTGGNRVTGSINVIDDRFAHTMLMAAESIRGLSDAQIYTSWNDFREMMDAEFGCVPVIDEDARTLTFQLRDAVFTATIARAFTADEVRDVEVRTAEDMLASKVSIGYEKQDYDSVNGRDEWRWTAEYKTGIEVTENELQLLCKYRGDAYGIEFLTLTRSEQTTDKDADEDIFLADCDTVGGVYTMRIDVPVSGVIAQNAMPNARYSQYYMAIANAFALGRLGSTLTFTSIGGNNDAVVGGRAVTANISLVGYTHPLPVEVTFTTAEQARYNWTGLITLPHGGRTYKGWLKDVRFGVGHDKVVTYTLIVNQIS